MSYYVAYDGDTCVGCFTSREDTAAVLGIKAESVTFLASPTNKRRCAERKRTSGVLVDRYEESEVAPCSA